MVHISLRSKVEIMFLESGLNFTWIGIECDYDESQKSPTRHYD